jgi:hypothetical protein
MHEIEELDRQGLRKFGILLAAFLAVIFGTVLPLLRNRPVSVWLWGAGGFILLWALAWPDGLRPVYRIWMRIGMVIGRVVNTVVLGVVFFGVVFPVGFVLRTCKKDPMRRNFDAALSTYREKCEVRDTNHLERIF